MSNGLSSAQSGRPTALRRRRVTIAALAGAAALTISACGSSSSSSSAGSSGSSGSGAKNVKVALILKTFSNPYFVSMENSAKADAAQRGVDLTVSAGTTDGDTATQMTAIDNAIAAGDAGIVITPNGNAVNSALTKARTAGLYTIALDTAPIPPTTVNLTYATDNTQAGKLDGQWAAAKLAGKPADIAVLDLFNNQVVSVDVQRDHGFLEGMGIAVGDPTINGKEPTSGSYTGGKGGTYKIACQLATQGAIPGGKSAMQTCLQKDPNINLVYAINEPAAEGAVQALAAAHNKALVVAVDGGCTNLPYLANGSIGATAGQFPGKMASDGVDAIFNLVTKHVHPATSPGLGFSNTGTTLYTNSPAPGVPSMPVAAAKKICWG
jgi:fructose transport system substrate-binding protein